MLNRNFTDSHLREAAIDNDLAFVNDYIKHYQNDPDALNKTNDLGETALFLALKHNHVEIVKLLAENGANVNQASATNGITPLIMAAAHGYFDIVKCLLDHNADIHQATTNEGGTPFMIAAQNGHLQIMKILFEKGANVNQARTDDGFTPLLYAAQHRESLPVVNALLEYGVDVNQAHRSDGRTALYIATCRGNLEIVNALLKKGAKVNASKNNGVTPLYIAAEGGCLEILVTLLKNNADPNLARTGDGITPCIAAALTGEVETLKALLENGSDINDGTPDDNCTALFIAAQRGHERVVKFLIEQPTINRLAALKSSKASLEDFAKDYSSEIQANIRDFIAQQKNPANIQITPEQIATLMGHTNIAMLIRNKGILPDECCCPISYVAMTDPIAVSSGITYERRALKEYYDRLSNNPATFPCPITGDILKATELDVKANVAIKNVIKKSQLFLFSKFALAPVTINRKNNLRYKSL